MREIKFRAWDRDRLKMEVWLLHDGKFLYPISEHEQHHKQEWDLMQFTGLKDKNGKEIYEGDIVRFKQLSGFACEDEYDQAKLDASDFYYTKPRVVEFKYGEFSPRERYHEVQDGYYSWRQFDFEVTGNIYENPEVLTPPTNS